MRLADFILANIEPILVEWEAFALSIWPSAAATDPATLRDDAEDLLRATAADMKSDQTATQQSDKSRGKGSGGSQRDRIDRASDAHGEERHSSGFDQVAVIWEYRALRASVIRLWRESNPQPNANDLDDLTRFNESIDQSLTEAVIAFTKLVEQERQTALDQQTRLARELREMNEALLVSSVRQHDLTEQAQKAEAMARASEERFHMLADNMAQLAWTCDSLGNVTWYNQRWLDYTGLTFDEMKGWDWSKVQHPDHLERVVRRMQQSAETGEPWEDTFPLRGKDGQYRWFLSRAVPIRDAAGRVIRWFGTNTDVTEQRELEQKILAQAKSLADLHRRKDEFLAMLSHELRNPLAPILNAVQLLHLQKEGSELQREAHGIIERQVSQLARLVDDLLEVSRISTGRIHLQEERIDLRGIVERALEATSPFCGQKSQSVAKSLPDQPVWVYGDPMRLEQVVVNLLNNACKYTDRNGHIWVGLEKQGDEAELRVRDNGIGIAPELLPHIFDLFMQADKSLDRSEGGLGIGLSLVQSLVTMHHGRVEAISTVGQGSEFIVRLPLMLSPGVLTAKPAEAVDRPAHSLKVLVVDDNIDAAKCIAMLLRASGHDARVAHEGSAAMQAALEYVPDVVLLDIGLPVISGYQVAQWIRNEPALKNVTLIALTGYGQESDRQRSQEAGFDHHLVKPVDFAKVQAILSAVADKVS